MDKITRDFLVMLLRQQHALSVAQAGIIRQVVGSRDVMAKSLRAVGEALMLISRVEDPEKRRGALDALWTLIDQTESQDELGRWIAKLESAHETNEAHIESLIKSLEGLDLDDNDTPSSEE